MYRINGSIRKWLFMLKQLNMCFIFISASEEVDETFHFGMLTSFNGLVFKCQDLLRLTVCDSL